MTPSRHTAGRTALHVGGAGAALAGGGGAWGWAPDVPVEMLTPRRVVRFDGLGFGLTGFAAPERVAALVLVAAAGYPRRTPLPLGLRVARSPVGAALMSHFLPRSAVAAGVRQSYGDPARVTDAVVERNYEITRRAGNHRALGATLRQADARDDSARIRTLQAPTLVLWGDRDTVIPPADAAHFHADVPGSALVTFPDLGHLPHEEGADETAAVVARFLARVGPPGSDRP